MSEIENFNQLVDRAMRIAGRAHMRPAIAKELLHYDILFCLDKEGLLDTLTFQEGTSLRLCYGASRFSEDLDFTLLKPDENFDFSPFLEGMRKELSSFGFNMEVTKKIKGIETSVISAFMKMNTIELYLAIGEEGKRVNHNEKVQIKLEVDVNPPSHARFENQLVLNPVTFYVLTLNKSDLFAGKMSAILSLGPV